MRRKALETVGLAQPANKRMLINAAGSVLSIMRSIA
jgi:hypothetical protein